MERIAWQCKCGHIEHGEMPEDCPNCLRVRKFLRVPEDQLEEALEGEVLSSQPGEEDEI